MNIDVKIKWVEALRSGKFEQTVGILKNTFGYCCLGVLREIMDPKDQNSFSFGIEAAPQNTMLTNAQLEKAGLDRGDACKLAEMNDDGTSFANIANHIEATL